MNKVVQGKDYNILYDCGPCLFCITPPQIHNCYLCSVVWVLSTVELIDFQLNQKFES